MKKFNSCIMTGLLVILFLIVGRYFLNSYREYVAHNEKKAVLVRKVGWLRQLKNEKERQLQRILKINDFVNKAKLLGLDQNKWEVYGVNIEDTITFEQLKTILKQCSNTNSHYFRPESFHIKSLKAVGSNEKMSGRIFENETADILMKLKGAFVVKN